SRVEACKKAWDETEPGTNEREQRGRKDAAERREKRLRKEETDARGAAKWKAR
ncbi:hypothetical protein KI387_011658, partial [Taxus chinensis]